MRTVNNFCLFYTKNDIENVSSTNVNRKFYVIGPPSEDEIYMCHTRGIIGYRNLALTSFGKRTLSDIDSYTLKNFYNEYDFFECLGLSRELFLPKAERKSKEYKSLFIGQIKDNGWVDKISPLFDNDELLKKINLFGNFKDDSIYDLEFLDSFYSLISDSNKGFYNFLKQKIDDKDELSILATQIRHVEREDVNLRNFYMVGDKESQRTLLRRRVLDYLTFYPTYRQAFLMVQKYHEFDRQEAIESSLNDEFPDPYKEITGISKSKKRFKSD